jgi:hypothetical protein
MEGREVGRDEEEVELVALAPAFFGGAFISECSAMHFSSFSITTIIISIDARQYHFNHHCHLPINPMT